MKIRAERQNFKDIHYLNNKEYENHKEDMIKNGWVAASTYGFNDRPIVHWFKKQELDSLTTQQSSIQLILLELLRFQNQVADFICCEQRTKNQLFYIYITKQGEAKTFIINYTEENNNINISSIISN